MLLMNRINNLRKKFEDKGLLDSINNEKVIIEAKDGLYLFDNCYVPILTKNFRDEYKKHYRKIDHITKDLGKYAIYDCKHCNAENVYIQGDNKGKYPPAVFAGIIPDNFNYDIWEGYR